MTNKTRHPDLKGSSIQERYAEIQRKSAVYDMRLEPRPYITCLDFYYSLSDLAHHPAKDC